eukprot:TRINITY_DN88189_c0_g1_i1.p1 TRINITY_DN88189_c0_g1~~TRINITY_DN88189_c0_g1_i1.p1  ORF type:complete len:614 (-),score=100.91 TRINITY_DN88189_c0_g1_i1:42-1883(-)
MMGVPPQLQHMAELFDGIIEKRDAELLRHLEDWLSRHERLLNAAMAASGTPASTCEHVSRDDDDGCAEIVNPQNIMYQSTDAPLANGSFRSDLLHPHGHCSIQPSEVKEAEAVPPEEDLGAEDRSNDSSDTTADGVVLSRLQLRKPTPLHTDKNARALQRSDSYIQAKESGRSKRRKSWSSDSSSSDIRTEEEMEHGVRRFVRNLTRSWVFELVCAIAILTNSIFIGVQVEWTAQGGKDTLIFLCIELAYVFWFTLEILLRLLADGVWRFVWASGHWSWNWLDIFVVTTSILDMALELTGNTDSSGSVSSTNMRILRIMRITRLIRSVRIIRVVRFIRALRQLVWSIVFTLRSLMWAVLLLVLIIYVFSITFTVAVTGYLSEHPGPWTAGSPGDILKERFGGLHSSMHTLFRAISGGLTWTDTADALVAVDWIWSYLFTFYITFCCFAVLNVMTGVFCHSAIQGSEKDQELVVQSVLQDKEKYMCSLKELFDQIDDDKGGFITIEEFENHFNDEAVRALLQVLHLDAADAWSLFRVLDMDGDSTIDAEEFLQGSLNFRGPAKSIDLVGVKRETRILRQLVRDVTEKQEVFEESLRELVRDLHEIVKQDRCQTK